MKEKVFLLFVLDYMVMSNSQLFSLHVYMTALFVAETLDSEVSLMFCIIWLI